MREVNVDYVVERCRAIRLTPHFTRYHLPRHRLIVMLREKREQIEFARRQRDFSRPAHDPPRLQVKGEITELLSQRISGINPPQQSANAREQLSKGKRLHQIIIGSGI